MKMDTTTWILLAVLAIMLWEMEKKKQAAAAGSLSGGYLPGAAGAAGKSGTSSLLQQLLGGTGNTQKPSAGISAGGSAGSPASSTVQPSKLKLPAWLMPPANQVSLAPNPPLTNTIASIPPPVWNSPEIDFPGVTPIATIPSDTSNIFITPEEPPTWTNPVMNTSTSATFVDDAGNPIDIPTDFSGNNFTGADEIPDPTAFSPVDTQTIDTSTLGNISYLPEPTYGGAGSGVDNLSNDYAYDYSGDG